jgi:hypothetical protein
LTAKNPFFDRNLTVTGGTDFLVKKRRFFCARDTERGECDAVLCSFSCLPPQKQGRFLRRYEVQEPAESVFNYISHFENGGNYGSRKNIFSGFFDFFFKNVAKKTFGRWVIQ